MVRLNIACGPNVFLSENWIQLDRESIYDYLNAMINNTNTQGMPKFQIDLINYLKNGGKILFKIHNMCKGFPEFQDSTVEGIYVGQAIEHINPIYEVPPFLSECYRMLKPGGVLRMTTPDLNILLAAYANNELDKFSSEQPEFYKNAHPSLQLSYMMFGASGPNCTFNNYEGHMCLYTRPSMTQILLNAGFKKENIYFYDKIGESKDPVMQKEVLDFGISHSMIVEAVK